MAKLFGAICAPTRQETSHRFLRLLPAPGILIGLLLGLLLAAMPLPAQQKVETMNDGSVITTKRDGTKHLALSNAVTSIKEWAFAWKQLTSVTIPPSVKTIGESAFASNRLTSVSIPSSVKTIKDYAFYENKLNTVILPTALYSKCKSSTFRDNSWHLIFYEYDASRRGNKGRYLGHNLE